ncbi:hypothetical protein Taro_046644 [Colocasia esculenta]|uniref:Late embryogenesis abundant protein LEA-2 subgroup domain-containing protein n=1 Tax=Colocasia esculenta TaxID=4460 RepID=A0A843X5U1_COLES|nr:hypothetical protein [Colocasia esculenta]
MEKPGDPSPRPKPESPPPPLDCRRRRRRCIAWSCCAVVALLILLAVVILVLALTVFKPREPKASLVSVTVRGVSPRITLPAIHVELNVTLDLDLLVRNPNRASFSHGAGASELSYGGARVGDAVVAPGRIPARGSGHVYSRLTLEADRFATDLGELLRDVLAGRVGFDSSTRIPGRIALLGFIKRNVVVFSDCHVVIGFPQLAVTEQECRQRTEL